jgi:hypothetical protein
MNFFSRLFIINSIQNEWLLVIKTIQNQLLLIIKALIDLRL